MSIDPTMTNLAVRLAELTVPNITADIYTRIQVITTRKADQQTVNELRGIIDELINQRNDLIDIARAYEAELISERISDDDIKYIIDTVIPALKDLVTKFGTSDPKVEESMDALASILSARMLKVLQLVGFNFKKAIGEPLTLLVERLITAQGRPDVQAETVRLNTEMSVAALNVSQTDESTERFDHVVAKLRGEI